MFLTDIRKEFYEVVTNQVSRLSSLYVHYLSLHTSLVAVC